MALRIVADNCTGCDACLPECPNDAIIQRKGTYFIEWEKCTECVGFYDEPQCAAVCPIDETCVLDPHHQESREELLMKKKRLQVEA